MMGNKKSSSPKGGSSPGRRWFRDLFERTTESTQKAAETVLEAESVTQNSTSTFFKEANDHIKKETRTVEVEKEKERAKKEEDLLEGKGDEEEKEKGKKAGSKVTDKVKKSFLEGLISTVIDIGTFSFLLWLADSENRKTVKKAFDVLAPVFNFLYTLFSDAIVGALDGITSALDALNWEKGIKPWQFIKSFSKFYLSMTVILAFFGNFTLVKLLFKVVNFFIKLPLRIKQLAKLTARTGRGLWRITKAFGRAFKFIWKGFKKLGRKVFGSGLARRLARAIKTGAKSAERPFTKIGRNAFKTAAKFLGRNGFKSIIALPVAVARRIPFIGTIIDFAINKFVFGLPTDESAIRAAGALMGATVGTAVAGFFGGLLGFGAGSVPAGLAGGAVGGMIGDWGAGLIYNAFLKDKSVPQMAEGGVVEDTTLAVIGESGTEYVIPEDKLVDFVNVGASSSVGLESPRYMVGSMEALVNSVGGNSSVYADLRNKISPLKNEFGSENFTFTNFSRANLAGENKNILSLTELETENLVNRLERIYSDNTGVSPSLISSTSSFSSPRNPSVSGSSASQPSMGGGTGASFGMGSSMGGGAGASFGEPDSMQTSNVSRELYDSQLSRGVYIEGGIGPDGQTQFRAHFHIERSDGADYGRTYLDEYVDVNGSPLSSGLTDEGGRYGMPRQRSWGMGTHQGWDYAFGGRGKLRLKNGARWISNVPGSYGDKAWFQVPSGEKFSIIHGDFDPEGLSLAESTPESLEPFSKAPTDDVASIDPDALFKAFKGVAASLGLTNRPMEPEDLKIEVEDDSEEETNIVNIINGYVNNVQFNAIQRIINKREDASMELQLIR